MMNHILLRKADEQFKLWCPYCDKIVIFYQQHWYDDIWCSECGRIFSPDPRHNKFPKGIDIKTGELINKV